MDSTENEKHIAVITEKLYNLDERITELAGNYNALQKSYYVLNECHHKLELGFTRMETEWKTTKGWVKWVLGGSALTFILGLVNLFKLFGWI